LPQKYVADFTEISILKISLKIQTKTTP